MAELENTIKRIEDWINAPFAMNAEIDPHIVHDALELLKSQQAEIERLEKENGTLKLAVQSMPNWLDEKRPEVVRCKDCKFLKPLELLAKQCCPLLSRAVSDDWFCACGERKED